MFTWGINQRWDLSSHVVLCRVAQRPYIYIVWRGNGPKQLFSYQLFKMLNENMAIEIRAHGWVIITTMVAWPVTCAGITLAALVVQCWRSRSFLSVSSLNDDSRAGSPSYYNLAQIFPSQSRNCASTHDECLAHRLCQRKCPKKLGSWHQTEHSVP